MYLFVKNSNFSLNLCLNVLKFVGFLNPHEPRENSKRYYNFYWVSWFMFVVGIANTTQIGEIFRSWGDIERVTSASYLLFTNLALSIKILYVVGRSGEIQAIIAEADDELRTEDRDKGVRIVRDCNRETTVWLWIYMWLSEMTVFGWACSAEKNQLPVRAWYPYDATKSPAYEFTYALQSTSLVFSALANVCLDTLVTSLVALCCCRLRLLKLSLRTLCDGIQIDCEKRITPKDDDTVYSRVQNCAQRHNAILQAATDIQACFNEPILSQFTVSTIIICVTAYHLAMDLTKGNWFRIIAMLSYLFCMMLQIFLYCYQGNQLTEESSEISGAVYECQWYGCSVRTRRALLFIMLRSRRVAKLTAGGFSTLSLDCFTAIIKASYTFFTVLRQVEADEAIRN